MRRIFTSKNHPQSKWDNNIHNSTRRNKICNRKIHATEKTPRLDLYFDNSELTTLSLLNCACVEFVCKSNEEYCILKFSPHKRQQPLLTHLSSSDENGKESKGKRKREKSLMIELEMELNDIVYRYGGEEVIRMSATTTPDHVLDAYTQLGRLREQRGEYHHDSFLIINRGTLERINNESSQLINEKCFEFVQKLVMKEHQVVDADRLWWDVYNRKWSNDPMLHISKPNVVFIDAI